ncbi:hypothetical protein [Sphingomonas aracearum]|uniref:Uncharacterized protein n=1 Tax=Sphingomonas aracearum TaxID=2283317 RepID=A0A369VTB8_9SPHN|nr:hypothetical protein [Sphingomonas aracearum]RDE05654.1 hypothetical protein DVW87_10570 [Sphingomonas aracearum]
MRKIVLVSLAAAAIALGACSGSEQGNTASTSELSRNEEVPADENLSAVDEATIGNNSADAALPGAANSSGSAF